MRISSILVITTATFCMDRVRAHHAAAAVFDVGKEVSIEGTVAEVRLVNPHAYMYVDVAAESGGTDRWKVELAGKMALAQRGWTNSTVSQGDRVRVIGNPSRREQNIIWWQRLQLADGSELKSPFVDDLDELDAQRRREADRSR